MLAQWALLKYAQRLQDCQLFVCHECSCPRLTSSDGLQVLSNDVPELQCCQEEADTRLFLHAKHASDAGSTVVIVRSPDTDVAVIGCFLASQVTAQLLLHTGTKHRRRYISLSAVAERLGTDVCRALPGFHAFTRCDSTSAFSGRGKKNGFNLLVEIDKEGNFCEIQ